MSALIYKRPESGVGRAYSHERKPCVLPYSASSCSDNKVRFSIRNDGQRQRLAYSCNCTDEAAERTEQITISTAEMTRAPRHPPKTRHADFCSHSIYHRTPRHVLKRENGSPSPFGSRSESPAQVFSAGQNAAVAKTLPLTTSLSFSDNYMA